MNGGPLPFLQGCEPVVMKYSASLFHGGLLIKTSVSEVIAKTPGGQVIFCAGPMNYAVAVCSDIWNLAIFCLSARIHRQHPKYQSTA